MLKYFLYPIYLLQLENYNLERFMHGSRLHFVRRPLDPRALVDLEYDSAPGNPAPSDAVLDVARKQAAAAAAGLPG